MSVVHQDGNCYQANVDQIVQKDIIKQNMVVKSAIIRAEIATVRYNSINKIKLYWNFLILGCKMQEGKRRIDVEALLLSAQPVSTLQLVNPFNFITGLAIIACLCIIILFIAIFIVLQVRILTK